MSEERTIAVLDGHNALIGTRRAVPEPSDLVVPDDIDLPKNGTYKWNAASRCFVPLGHGFPRISMKPPVSEARVLYLLAKTLGDQTPSEVNDWVNWYELNLKVRDEELQVAARRKAGR